MQARINSGEAAQQKLELQLSELQPHAAKLEESLQDSQTKLKTTQNELASARAEDAQIKVSIQEGTVLCRNTHLNMSMKQAVQVYEVPCEHSQLLLHTSAINRNLQLCRQTFQSQQRIWRGRVSIGQIMQMSC